MGPVARTFRKGDRTPPSSKTITQELIDVFERSGPNRGPSQFTSEERARSVLGTRSTIASGRMSLSWGTELLRRFFGPEVYNRHGMVDLRFLRPLRPGDTVTFVGTVIDITRVADGCRVAMDVQATNQNGDITASGSGSCTVPSLWMPEEQ